MITDPVLGYRVWGWRDGRLWSPIFAQPWAPLERFTAVCRDGEHFPCGYSPHEGCGCGVHLAASEREAVETLAFIALFVTRYPLVWGLCSGWGRVVEHERGWRVEHAYPYELHSLEPGLASEVRGTYAVDCTTA